jgi:uncharacterized membrane protein
MKNQTKHCNKTIHIGIIAIILLSFATAAYFYNKMPERMISHWDALGNPNGYMSKCWALYLMPIITILMYLMLIFIPKIDPLKKNVDKFRGYFDWFILMLVVFFVYIYFLTIAANLGHVFNMTSAMLPAVGLLFVFVGQMLLHAERNWFIGIRTPWTLSSDKVWKKTNTLGGKLFKFAGAIVILSVFAGRFAFLIMLTSVLLAAFVPLIYSYFEYKKEKK